MEATSYRGEGAAPTDYSCYTYTYPCKRGQGECVGRAQDVPDTPCHQANP